MLRECKKLNCSLIKKISESKLAETLKILDLSYNMELFLQIQKEEEEDEFKNYISRLESLEQLVMFDVLDYNVSIIIELKKFFDQKRSEKVEIRVGMKAYEDNLMKLGEELGIELVI